MLKNYTSLQPCQEIRKRPSRGRQEKGASGSKAGAVPAPKSAKRTIEEVANSSAEEIALLSTHMDELSTDMKQIKDNISDLMKKSDDMMTKADMKTFIKSTVEEIMTEIYKTIEVTIDIKVKEKNRNNEETD